MWNYTVLAKDGHTVSRSSKLDEDEFIEWLLSIKPWLSGCRIIKKVLVEEEPKPKRPGRPKKKMDIPDPLD